MLILNRFIKKKYLMQIYLVISITSILFITAILWSSYYAINKNIFKIEYNSSIDILSQIKGNIDFVEETSKNVGYAILNSNSSKYLLNTNEGYDVKMIESINELSQSFVETNPSVHSIYLFNSIRSEYYSTNNGISNIDKSFEQDVRNGIFKQQFKAYVRTIDNKTVLTYKVDDSFGLSTTKSSCIYVNINFDWFLKYIDQMNQINNSNHSSLFIFDENNKCIKSFSQNPAFLVTAQKALSDKIASISKNNHAELVDVNISEKKYVATVLSAGKNGWNFVRIYPYKELFKGIYKIKFIFIIINLIAVIGMMLVFFVIAKKIYKPINRLLKKLNLNNTVCENQTEFDLIEQSFLNSKMETTILEQKIDKRLKIVREYMLKKLIFESEEMSNSQINSLICEYKFLIDTNSHIQIIVLAIDDFNELSKDYNKKIDRGLVEFAITNIISEYFLQNNINTEMTFLDEKYLTIICNDCDNPEPINVLNLSLKVIFELFNLTFSIAISTSIIEFAKISETYYLLKEKLKDRFILGNSCIIYQNQNTSHNQIFVNYTFSDEDSFLNAVSQIRVDDAKKAFQNLLEKIKKLDYESAVIAITHLTNSIRQIMFDVNKHKKEPIDMEPYFKLWNKVPDITLNDYACGIFNFINSLKCQTNTSNNRHKNISEAVIEYINNMYADYNLSATYLSDELKISPAHLGRIFKEYTDMAIPEYINHIRLNKAIEWMKNSDLTISQIMMKVGYQNESYFYKVFKDKTGMSPRVYMKTVHKGH